METLALQDMGVAPTLLPGYEDPVTKKKEWEHPTQEEIDEMQTPFLSKSISLWMTIKRWGLPSGGHGWLDNERATTMDIINILETESIRYDNWEMKHRDELPDDEDE